MAENVFNESIVLTVNGTSDPINLKMFSNGLGREWSVAVFGDGGFDGASIQLVGADVSSPSEQYNIDDPFTANGSVVVAGGRQLLATASSMGSNTITVIARPLS